jgi:hypothetical protein
MTTSAIPAVPAGVVAVICESLTTTILDAVMPPMVTAVAPVKPVPVIVTAVPPDVVPITGAMLVKIGAARLSHVVVADADEVIIPRTAMVRQKTRKKVLAFIYIPTQDTFVSHSPEAVVPDGSVPPFGAAFCPFLW